MTVYLDTSVLVAALVEDEPTHDACLRLLRGKKAAVWTHGLAETFATLTGGRLGIRTSPTVAARLIEDSLMPRLRMVELGATDVGEAIRGTQAAGVRGGAIFDFLHLSAARKSAATTLYTLNARHFLPIVSGNAPRIEAPR